MRLSGQLVRWCLPIATLCVLAGCREQAAPKVVPPAAATVQFEEVTEAAGLRFKHHNGATGRKWMPETMGSGCAFLDANADGRLDVLLVDSTAWPGASAQAQTGRTRLFLNQGNTRFQDVTEAWGLPAGFYGMGVAAADYNADGYPDLFLTGVGLKGRNGGSGCRLLRNRAGTGFEEVTEREGLRIPGWSTGAVWLDYDRDGLLDLFVARYVRWSPEADQFFSLDGTHKSYARPDQYAADRCMLWRNTGSGFQDRSAEAGVGSVLGKALGVALCDFDRDGWPDVAVANDTVPNFLFHNQGLGGTSGPGEGGKVGRFKEVALQAGIAVAEGGRAKAGMGIDTADFDHSGREAILITNFTGEQLSLYQRDTSSLFMEVAARTGIGTPSQRFLGFGALFMDADLDGWVDILVANGHIQDDVSLRSSETTYAQPGLFFRGSPGGAFLNQSGGSGALQQPRVARGAAYGDVDGDGDLDVLISTSGGAPALLRQAGRPTHHWLRVRLKARGKNRDGIGAMVRVKVGGETQSHMVRGGGSYLSQSDLFPTFGLGTAASATEVEVRWPDGSVESFGEVSGDRTVTLVQDQGKG